MRDRQRGQGMVEYALVLLLIAVVAIVSVALLGGQLRDVFSNLVVSL